MDKVREKNTRKVVVAMSGGVDSSVAAALLKRAGFYVIGVFMKFWTEPQINTDKKIDLHRYPSEAKPSEGGRRIFKFFDYENRCCSTEAENRARKVAKILNIPFYVFNFEREFKKKVVDYFLKEYKEGRTPNPCVVCNKEIKFGLLLEKALGLGVDLIATGHYARLRREIPNPKSQIPKFKLLRGKDKNKDQSYFLWQLNQRQLKRILFPVGDYTKDKVRIMAKKFNLPVLDIPESQEICFIHAKLDDFLARHIKTKPGFILTTEVSGRKQASCGASKKIGRHQGLPFYTIGQRKGIELSGGPFYVAGKDLKKNTLIVTSLFNDKILYSKELIAKNVNWISGKEPEFSIKVKAQIRYGHKPVSAEITKKIKNRKIELIFARPQRAITPGQSVVFYQGQELVGGGIIC